MRIGIPKEKNDNETRVAVVPVSIPKLMKLGFNVVIEKGAGVNSGYTDSEYEEKGAKTASSEEVMKSELIASIDVPNFKDMKKGQMLACVADPFRNLEQTKEIINAGITLLSLEVIPRTLSENAGLDPVNTIIELRKAHAEGKVTYGVNVFEGGVMDMKEANVIEPLRVVEQAIQSATETAVMILRIDDVISSKAVSGAGMEGMDFDM